MKVLSTPSTFPPRAPTCTSSPLPRCPRHLHPRSPMSTCHQLLFCKRRSLVYESSLGVSRTRLDSSPLPLVSVGRLPLSVCRPSSVTSEVRRLSSLVSSYHRTLPRHVQLFVNSKTSIFLFNLHVFSTPQCTISSWGSFDLYLGLLHLLTPSSLFCNILTFSFS